MLPGLPSWRCSVEASPKASGTRQAYPFDVEDGNGDGDSIDDVYLDGRQSGESESSNNACCMAVDVARPHPAGGSADDVGCPSAGGLRSRAPTIERGQTHES